MAITLGTPISSGNLTASTGTTMSFTTVTNTKTLVVILTGADTASADRIVNSMTFNGVDMTLRRHYDSQYQVQIWYLKNPYIGTANIVVTMGGANTDLQITAVSLISSTAPEIVPGAFMESTTGSNTIHSVIVPGGKAGRVIVGGIVDIQSTVASLSVVSGSGSELAGSEADMGSQVVGCAYNFSEAWPAVELTPSIMNWNGVSVNSSNGDVWACINGGDIWKYTTASGVWTAQNASGIARSWYSVSVNSSNGDVWTTVNGGDIYKYTVASGTWTAQNVTGSNKNWYGVSVNPTNGDVWACIFDGDIYKYTVASGTWTAQNATGAVKSWVGVSVNPMNGDVWAGISNGTVYKYTTASGIWIIQTMPGGAHYWRGFSFNVNGDIYACDGNPGDIYKYTTASGVFTAQSVPGGVKSWRGISVNISNGDVFACVSPGYIYSEIGSEIRWSKSTNAVSYALAATFYEQSPPTVALNTPNDTAINQSVTLDLIFTGTDADGDILEYEVQVDTVNTFNSVSVGFNLKYITLYVNKVGSPTDNCYLEIRDGTNPANTLLGTSNAVACSSFSPAGEKEFTFSTPISLNAGASYILIVRRTSIYDTTNYIAIVSSTSPGYSGGVGWAKEDGSWSTGTIADFYFKIKDENSVIILSHISSLTYLIIYGDGGAGESRGQTFTVSITGPVIKKLSSIPDATFTDVTNSLNTHPFTSGDQIKYTVQ